MSNEIDHPSHYNGGKIEVIDIIEDQNFPQDVAGSELPGVLKKPINEPNLTTEPIPRPLEHLKFLW